MRAKVVVLALFGTCIFLSSLVPAEAKKHGKAKAVEWQPWSAVRQISAPKSKKDEPARFSKFNFQRKEPSKAQKLDNPLPPKKAPDAAPAAPLTATTDVDAYLKALPGAGTCPILWSGNAECTKAVVLKSWCIRPMTTVDPRDLFTESKKHNTFIMPLKGAASFTSLIRPADLPAGLQWQDLLLTKSNSWALGIMNRHGSLSDRKQNALPPADLPGLFTFDKCAVVGNSKSMASKKMGKLIDQADFVMRFNNAPVKGYEKSVGSKTSVRIQNPEREGYHERGEWCIVKTPGKVGNTDCKFVSLSPQFQVYSNYYWQIFQKPGYRPPRVEGEFRAKFSTGFQGVVLALHVCKQVDVYGFDSSGTHYYKWKRTGGLKNWQDRHPWSAERECMNLLTKFPSFNIHT